MVVSLVLLAACLATLARSATRLAAADRHLKGASIAGATEAVRGLELAREELAAALAGDGGDDGDLTEPR